MDQFRVLVIDDQSEALEMLRIVLTIEGFDVVLAADALSGLRAAYQTRPDAILLDVMMPEVDGFEACRRLREMTDVPIIFVTAKGTIEDIVRGLSLGADDYMVKPYRRSELVSRLMACMRRAGESNNETGDYLFPFSVLFCPRVSYNGSAAPGRGIVSNPRRVRPHCQERPNDRFQSHDIGSHQTGG